MSRELRFRQKLNDQTSKLAGESFHYWGRIDGGFVSPVGKNHVESESNDEQFTGLTDKNGVDIYEGDLIKNKTDRVCKVTFNDFCATFDCEPVVVPHESTELGFECRDWGRCVEIIGNIHQHKELLND